MARLFMEAPIHSHSHLKPVLPKGPSINSLLSITIHHIVKGCKRIVDRAKRHIHKAQRLIGRAELGIQQGFPGFKPALERLNVLLDAPDIIIESVHGVSYRTVVRIR
jgi:hypothetical protein